MAKTRDAAEAIRRSSRYKRAAQHPEVFDIFVDLAVLCKWRGPIITQEDVHRHNLFEEFLGLFHPSESAYTLNRDEVKSQLQAALGRAEIEEDV